MVKLPTRKILVPRAAGTVKMSQIKAAVKRVRAMRLSGKLPKVGKSDKEKVNRGIRLHAAS